jgi:hypothetical protein
MNTVETCMSTVFFELWELRRGSIVKTKVGADAPYAMHRVASPTRSGPSADELTRAALFDGDFVDFHESGSRDCHAGPGGTFSGGCSEPASDS